MSEQVDVASELAASCPELAIDWQVHGSDLDLPYVALGHLASRLVQVRRRYPAADFRPLFNDVEIRIGAAEPGVRNLVTVGFLEALQNVERDAGARWENLMGPETLAAWRALNDFWTGRMSSEDFNRIVG